MNIEKTCACNSLDALIPCAIIFMIIVFFGEPDLVDGVIFKLTGVKNW